MRIKKIALPLFLSLVLLSRNLFAEDITISQDNEYIYYKIHYKVLNEGERRYLLDQSTNFVLERLKEKIPETEINETVLDSLAKVEKEIDPLLKKMQALYKKKSKLKTSWRQDLWPAAFAFYIGGHFMLQFMMGGGAGLAIGIVMMPFKVVRIHKVLKEISQYYIIDYSWIALAEVQTGVGHSVGPSFVLGMGTVWGGLNRPEEFKGILYGLNGYCTFMGSGGHVMAGFLDRLDMKGLFDNYYMSAGLIFGLPLVPPGVIPCGGGGKLSLVVDAERLMSAVGFEDNKKNDRPKFPHDAAGAAGPSDNTSSHTEEVPLQFQDAQDFEKLLRQNNAEFK